MQEKVQNGAKKALKLAIVFMIFHVFFSFVRANLTLMVTAIMTFIVEEMGVTLAAGGQLYTLASTIMGIGMLFGSVLIDKIGTSKSLFLSIIITALCGIVGWFSPNYSVLLASRVLLGIANAISYPAVMTIVAERFHNQSQRAMASSLVQATNSLTNVATQNITVPMFMMLGQNWHNQMLIWGLLAAALAVVFVLGDRKPTAFFTEYNAGLSAGKSDSSEVPKESGSSLLKALKFRSVWAAVISFTGATWLYTLYMTFLPTIPKTVHGMTPAEASSITSLINLTGVVFCLASGFLLRKLKNFKVPMVCMMVILTAGGIFAMLAKPGIGMTVSVLMIGIGWFCNIPLVNTAVMIADGITPKIFAAATAIWTVLGCVLGMFIPSLFSALAEVHGMQHAVIILCSGGIVAILGALMFPNKTTKAAE